MLKEYGGYIELDTYRQPMLHEGALALNCGRNCLAYLIEARQIRTILLPYLLCDSVIDLCHKYNVKINFYHIDRYFKPVHISLKDDEWLYIVNYYGQLDREYLSELKRIYDKVIIDNAQAYFEKPIEHTDTIYTCRKFFGVPDGGFLYTDAVSDADYQKDESFERMHYLLGRFERTASEFYSEYVSNNHMFSGEPVKLMSRLTENLLHGIDYDYVKDRRTENFRLYHDQFRKISKTELREIQGAFAYPLMTGNGKELRKTLRQKNIYIPLLWPNVINDCSGDSLEYLFAENILPLPCDQRYDSNDINFIIEAIIDSS